MRKSPRDLMMLLSKTQKGLGPEAIRTLFKTLVGNRKPKVKGVVQPPQPGSSVYSKKSEGTKGY